MLLPLVQRAPDAVPPFGLLKSRNGAGSFQAIAYVLDEVASDGETGRDGTVRLIRLVGQLDRDQPALLCVAIPSQLFNYVAGGIKDLHSDASHARPDQD
ncbi:hypothetical protein [Rhodoplanes sp. SY1]|uniref:hypothetical protein n=1 Tax=Rhodoplanes sp. SY1 TaxID=3166646 RepID=UPI0038B58C13